MPEITIESADTTILEAENFKNFKTDNKGREGSTVIDDKGKEIPGSIYLGGTAYVQTDGDMYIIRTVEMITGSRQKLQLTKKQIQVLKKV